MDNNNTILKILFRVLKEEKIYYNLLNNDKDNIIISYLNSSINDNKKLFEIISGIENILLRHNIANNSTLFKFRHVLLLRIKINTAKLFISFLKENKLLNLFKLDFIKSEELNLFNYDDETIIYNYCISKYISYDFYIRYNIHKLTKTCNKLNERLNFLEKNILILNNGGIIVNDDSLIDNFYDNDKIKLIKTKITNLLALIDAWDNYYYLWMSYYNKYKYKMIVY